MHNYSVTRFCRSLHGWGGFTLSLLIMLISLSGTLLVWKKEFLWLTIPEARESMDLTPSIAAEIVASAERSFDSGDILLVQFQSENLSIHKLFLNDSQYAYLDNRGELVDHWHLNERPEEWLYDLHHRLLVGNTGMLISGFAALAMLGLMPFALVAWWPTRKSFSWRIVAKGILRPQLLATHRNLGILAALPISMLLLSGVILAFPEQAQQVMVEPHTNKESYSNLYVQKLDNISGAEQGTWEQSFRRALASMDGARIRSAQLPRGYLGYNLIGLQQTGDWHPSGLSKIYIEPTGGLMDMRLDALQLPLSERIYNLNYPLHTGKVHSLLYRLVLTSVGLSIFTLSLLGFISFIKKLGATKK